MKKYFIFAAIATAGLFASCSSSDDVAVSGGQEPIENAEAREAIRLNLATPTAMITRGTGTVGGVGVANDADTHHSANVWSGQSINVFMFTKGTTADQYATTLNLTAAHEPGAQAVTYLYDNTEMITPGSSANKITSPNDESTDTDGSGEAMIKDGTIQYYPPQGNFDFFGYHGDDAVATTATISRWDANGDEIQSSVTSYADDVKWTVPFTINGTQDLMSTKAELTGEANDASSQVGIMAAAAGGATDRSKDYFSAYAARKGVHPTLTFKHLLTRLQFSIIAGNDAAAGWVPATTAGTYTAEQAITYNQGLDNAIKASDDAYSFTTCDINNANNVYATGLVVVVPDDATTPAWSGWTKFKVLTNVAANTNVTNAADFIGHEYFIHTTSFESGPYQLYTAAEDIDANKVEGVGVKATAAATDAEEAAYNATLNGHVSQGDPIPATAAHQDDERAVKVTSIQVLSENTMGDLAVAWTAANLTDPEKISWDAYQQPAAADRWLTLMERPSVMYNRNDGATITYADIDAYQNEDYDNLDETTTPKKSVVDAAVAAAGARITAAVYETLTQTGKDKYTIDNTTTANDKLVDLTATAPDIDGTKADKAAGRYPATRVGESIILSPGLYNADGVAQINNANTPALRMKITLAQKVPTNWNDPDNLTLKTQEYELDIPAPLLPGSATEKGFKQNTSYNVKLTVYGLERIVVMAVVEPWVDGGDIEVGADD